MKRLILTFALLAASFGLASAQNYMVVNSETVFKSIPEYNSALERIEPLADQYQQQVDDRFAAVETLYNNYMAQRSSLSESARQTRENAILQREKEAAEFQESLFGTDGELMKKRLELIQPIQQRVFSTIESFCKQHGYDLVIDIAANPTVLYNSLRIDFTQRIIDALK